MEARCGGRGVPWYFSVVAGVHGLTFTKNGPFTRSMILSFTFVYVLAYGVRSRRTSALRDQLDAAPAMASQIGDGSTVRKAIAHRTAVADFRKSAPLDLQLVPQFALLAGPWRR